MPEADPTAEPGATDTDEPDKNDPTQKPGDGASDTDDSTGGKADKKKADSKSDDQDSKGKDWEASYKGLQPKYQALVEEQKTWEEKRLALGGQIAELETTVKASVETVKTMEQGAKDAETASEEMQKTVTGLEADKARTDLIMGDYPQLAGMEAKGLLPPDLEGDELKGKLDSMLEVLVEQGVDNTGKKIAGSTGEEEEIGTGKRSQGDDIGSISNQLMEANKTGDPKEASRLLALLVDAQNKKWGSDLPPED